MRHVQRGDFEHALSRLPPDNRIRNEVGFATSTFRTTVIQLRNHIKNEFELKLLRQQAEYKALLMQINPHFLFNTLELISSLTVQKRTEDTLRVVESLGRMMRFSLKISDDLIHYMTPEVVTERTGGRLTIVARDGEEVLIANFSDESATWAVKTCDPVLVLVATEYIRHDIMIEAITARLGPEKLDALWRNNPDLVHVMTGKRNDGQNEV
ncbi:histidine kinase [Paenibacillus sp. 32O-W]|nr:histidine kinase [Paenibacillus sp. 32O-W]ALS28649.1 histidine kinase [Paenibacillus sp. 32O-W]